MLIVKEKTPLREEDRVHSLSQEKKCLTQIKQGNKMICIQGKSIQKQGASLGAVVVVKVDHHMVSHTIGIVGTIYQMKKSGRRRIATIAGILSLASRRGDWWIPLDQEVPGG
jgi:hypothetical protein